MWPPPPEALDRCLLHVLLWQYLKRRNVMHVVALALQHASPPASEAEDAPRRTRRRRAGAGAARGGDASGYGSFLEDVGVPLALRALSQVWLAAETACKDDLCTIRLKFAVLFPLCTRGCAPVHLCGGL